MKSNIIFAVLLLLSGVSWFYGRRRALQLVKGKVRELHSLPTYYGWHTLIWTLLPGLVLMLVWLVAEPFVLTHMAINSLPEEMIAERSPAEIHLLINELHNMLHGIIMNEHPAMLAAVKMYQHAFNFSRGILFFLVCAVALLGGLPAYARITPTFRARNRVERVILWLLMGCSILAILATIGVVCSVLFESIHFFRYVPISEFLFGLNWSPQVAIRADQVGSSGSFGVIPLLLGTIMISTIAMLVAVPLGLFSAIYLSEYASRKARAWIKPLLEILAGIPTVVYGFFAALTVAPLVRHFGESIGLNIASESALVAGFVMGVMIIPFVSSLSDDVINAVPQTLRDGSYALGATPAETVRLVVLPAALPGIVGSVLLAVSRAIGETMIVVMAAGLTAKLTLNPLDSVTTVTVQIVTLLVGDQEFDSPKTLAAFALGLLLFITTLILNIIALRVVRKYREQYE